VLSTSSIASEYLCDASGFLGSASQLFRPTSVDEVREIVNAAVASKTPLTLSGGRTGLTGGCVAQGGWILSLDRMNKLSIESGVAHAGAGVLLHEIHREAAATGQFLGPNPTETWASVGGAVNCNASGSRSFRYGSMRRHVLGLELVFMDGRVLRVRRGDKVDFPVVAVPVPVTTKHTAGYYLRPDLDWIDLIAASEGTLAIVTHADLQLLPAPAHVLAGLVFFPSDELALAAVRAWRPVAGLRVLEYVDKPSLEFIRVKYPDIPANAGAALLIEAEVASQGDSSEDATDGWLARMGESGALENSWFGVTERDRERFRTFRHALPEEVHRVVRGRGLETIGSDFAVPIAQNETMLAYYRDQCEQHFHGNYVIFGHMGDAHVHVSLLPLDEAHAAIGRQLTVKFAMKAVELGGTVGAEHGLGKRKAHLLPLLYSEEQIEAMRAVKRRLDPEWLLGQGNLLGRGPSEA
jgi:FAD/FMN-containing dehydrogenase